MEATVVEVAVGTNDVLVVAITAGCVSGCGNRSHSRRYWQWQWWTADDGLGSYEGFLYTLPLVRESNPSLIPSLFKIERESIRL